MSELAATPEVVGAPEAADASAAQGQETPAQEAARKWKVKVNNQETEVDEKELLTGYQTRKASDEKFRQASEYYKKAEGIQKEYDSYAKNPRAFFEKNGMNPEQWAEEILIQKLELEQMSPDKREALEAKKKLKALEDERAKEKEELESKQVEELKYQAVQHIDDDISAALKGASLDKIEPVFVLAVVDKMIAYLDSHDGEAMPAAEAVRLVKQESEDRAKALIKRLDVNDLMALLSDKSDAIRKHFVDQVIENSPMRKPQAKGEPRAQAAKQKPMTTDEKFKQMEQKFT